MRDLADPGPAAARPACLPGGPRRPTELRVLLPARLRPAMTEVKQQLRIHDLRHAYASLLLAFGETVLYT